MTVVPTEAKAVSPAGAMDGRAVKAAIAIAGGMIGLAFGGAAGLLVGAGPGVVVAPALASKRAR